MTDLEILNMKTGGYCATCLHITAECICNNSEELFRKLKDESAPLVGRTLQECEEIKGHDGFVYWVDEKIEAEDDEYVYAPDTSLCKGFQFGKINKEQRKESFKRAGFKFYKIVASDNPKLGLPLSIEAASHPQPSDIREQTPVSDVVEFPKKIFTRDEVIKIIGDLLERPDMLINAVTIESSDYDAETCLEIAEQQFK